jgi:CDP-diacylglycerol--glycerol-3-phosphate 3-phosphatidyltransferase
MRLPTQLTVLRIALAAVFFVLFALVQPPKTEWAIGIFIVASITDWWDGHIARKMNLTSSLGAFLDPLADKMLTGAAFIAFAWQGYIPWWMVIVVVLRDGYLTLFRLLADTQGLTVQTSYIAKVKTVVQMVFISVMLFALVAADGAFGTSLREIGKQITDPARRGGLLWPMGIVTFLTAASAALYSYDNWPALRAVVSRYLLRRPTRTNRASARTNRASARTNRASAQETI